jgi:hypothetical protein
VTINQNSDIALSSATAGQAWLDFGPAATEPRSLQKLWRSTTVKDITSFRSPGKGHFNAFSDSRFTRLDRDKANNIRRMHGGVRFCLALSCS